MPPRGGEDLDLLDAAEELMQRQQPEEEPPESPAGSSSSGSYTTGSESDEAAVPGGDGSDADAPPPHQAAAGGAGDAGDELPLLTSATWTPNHTFKVSAARAGAHALPGWRGAPPSRNSPPHHARQVLLVGDSGVGKTCLVMRCVPSVARRVRWAAAALQRASRVCWLLPCALFLLQVHRRQV